MPLRGLLGFLKRNKEKKREFQDSTNENNTFIAGQIGAYAAKNYASATDTGFEGMNLFREAAKNLANVDLDIRQGNLFEYIEATKFNIDAATKSETVRAHVTAAEGLPHYKADVFFKEGNKIVGEAQMKSVNPEAYGGKGIAKQTAYLSSAKYRGMEKAVNKGHEVQVKELAEKGAIRGNIYSEDLADTAKNATGELKHGNVTSHGTTFKENIRAAQNPSTYAVQTELKVIGREMAVTGAEAAAAGAVFGGAISIVKNTFAVSKGEITGQEAATNVLKETVKAGGRSGCTGIVGVGIRTGAKKAGLNAFTKSNVATAVAAGVIETGVTVLRYAKGEISGEEAIEKIGQNGISTASSIYTGAAAGAIFGPVGALVGSVAGYLIASNVYQSCLSIMQSAYLAEQEVERVVALSRVACEEMRNQREDFERAVQYKLNQKKEEFEQIFGRIDKGIINNDDLNIINALADFALLFNQKLRLQNYKEFDTYMKSDGDLIL